MGNAFIYGGGATAESDLNFRFKSYTTEAALLLDTPPENTIGVVTTTPIGKYAFSATEPTTIDGAAVSEGDVWILDGTASPAAMQVSKKNGVEVWAYPLLCKQYISGTWVAKTAESYIGGAWIGFETYLYNNGDNIGGMIGKRLWYTGGAGGVTFETAQVTLQVQSSYNNQGPGGSEIVSPQLINLTNVATITVLCFQTGGEGFVYVNATNTPSFPGAATAAHTSIPTATSMQSVSLDVSALSGSYYIGVAAAINQAGNPIRYAYVQTVKYV